MTKPTDQEIVINKLGLLYSCAYGCDADDGIDALNRLEKEAAENCQLLGISGERELLLRTDIDKLKKEIAQLRTELATSDSEVIARGKRIEKLEDNLRNFTQGDDSPFTMDCKLVLARKALAQSRGNAK